MKYNKTNICSEAPVNLIVNNQKVITFMCTPLDLEDLALGHLYTRGMMKNIDELLGIGVCSENKKVTVILNKKIEESEEDSYFPNILLTSCGSGSTFDETKFKSDFLKTEKFFELEKIKKSFVALLENAVIYKKTGGMHCALIGVEGKNYIREDIGRHNAVDKVIGTVLKEKGNLEESFIISTGRISVDMVLKAATLRIPVVSSRSIASDLAIEIANRVGITLIGRINSVDPIIYTYEGRIKKTAN